MPDTSDKVKENIENNISKVCDDIQAMLAVCCPCDCGNCQYEYLCVHN